MRNENTDLTAIVARLERQLRTVRLTLGIGLLGIAGIALTAWVSPQGDTVTAKQFMVIDADGIPRGMFGVLADQASIGMMYTDPSGNQRIEMGVNPDGLPRLVLLDEAGRIRSEITDQGFDNNLLKEIGENLPSGGSVIVAVIEETWVGKLETALQGYVDLERYALDADAAAVLGAQLSGVD